MYFLRMFNPRPIYVSHTLYSKCYTTAPGSSLPSFVAKCSSIMESIHIDRGKLLQLILALDFKKASGCDGISVSMTKMCDISFVEPMCLIFEKCLEAGSYPSFWKKANVIPIHEEYNKQNKCNYRPISLFPLFGKVFEKISFDGIYKHLTEHDLITSK